MRIAFDSYERLAMAVQPRFSFSNEEAANEINGVLLKHFGCLNLEFVEPNHLPNPQIVKHFYGGRKWKQVLSKEELEIIVARFSLDYNIPKELKGLVRGDRRLTLTEVSVLLGHDSREKVRQIENKAIKKLRSFFAEIKD